MFMYGPNNAPILEYLTSRQGLYRGHGTNYEGLPFQATFEIRPRVDGNVIEIRFRAQDEDHAFHEELTWISSDLIGNRVALWTVSTNTPGVLRHDLVEDTSDDFKERRFVFRLGEPENRNAFRQEIILDSLRDGTFEYRYGWGVPHDAFSSRTRAVLNPVQGSGPAQT